MFFIGNLNGQNFNEVKQVYSVNSNLNLIGFSIGGIENENYLFIDFSLNTNFQKYGYANIGFGKQSGNIYISGLIGLYNDNRLNQNYSNINYGIESGIIYKKLICGVSYTNNIGMIFKLGIVL